jgi:Fe-S-cluster containining protein
MADPIKRDAVGRLSRPVEVPWTCRQTGDCCRVMAKMLVTKEERAVLDLHQAAARRPLIWSRPDDGKLDAMGFRILEMGPCPFLSEEGKCMVHPVRPYNCRRFMCGRVDTDTESLELGGPAGCYNLSDRLSTSVRFMEFYNAGERRAYKDWGQYNGWKRNPTPPIEVKL